MSATTTGSNSLPLMLIGGELRFSRSGETLKRRQPRDRRRRSPASPAAAPRMSTTRSPPRARRCRHWRATRGRWPAPKPVRQLADVIVEHAEDSRCWTSMRTAARSARCARHIRRRVALRHFAGMALDLRGEQFQAATATGLHPAAAVRGRRSDHPVQPSAAVCRLQDRAPLIAGNTWSSSPPRTRRCRRCHSGSWRRHFPPGCSMSSPAPAPEAADALVTHPEVRRLAFIGSADTGRQIQQRAATHVVKTVTLELGGKNPIAVFPDADLDRRSRGSPGDELHLARTVLRLDLAAAGARASARPVRRPAGRADGRAAGRAARDDATDTGAIVHRGQHDKVRRYLQLGRARAHASSSAGDLTRIRSSPRDLHSADAVR